MNRWVKVGGAVLLLAWTPFLYAELTSDPHEKKDRVIPDLAESDPIPVAGTGAETAGEEDEDPEATEEKTEAVIAAPSPEPQKAPDEGIEPQAAEDLAAPDNEPTGAAHQAPLPQSQGPVAALKSAFDSEPRDALWAKDAEAKIAGVYSGEDIPESLFDKSACRTAVCRVELTWSQENAAPFLDTVDELHKAFAADFAVDPQAPADKEGEDALAVHVYLMRQGYTVDDVNK